MTLERSGVVYIVDPAVPGSCRVATIKEFFEYHARLRCVSYEDVVHECYRQAEILARERKLGAMAFDYDPRKDESHPSRYDQSAG